MADYTTSEILNEVSRIFRARLDPGRDGGTFNTKTEYKQLLEIAYITFLLHTDSIFYLALLARNSLNTKLRQEVALVEDMLVALDDLGQVGSAVKDTATLNNANTALLTLDAAQSVTDRPETKRFSFLMDKYAEQFRKNIISRATGVLVRPREDARNILSLNMRKLEAVHNQLLTATFSLRDLLSNFNALDIPSRVAATTISNIRENVQSMVDEIESRPDAELLAKSRKNLLTTLASKMAVQILAGFTNPRKVKVRSPVNPTPEGINHYGRVTGLGDPAYVLSGPGPWELPVSDPLTIRVNGKTSYTVDVDTIVGAAINGRSLETFQVEEGYRELHVLVDPEIYTGVTSSHTASDFTVPTFFPLGFKHLGSPIVMIGAATTEQETRSLVEHRLLQTFSSVSGFDSAARRITVSGPSAGDEPGSGLLGSDHIGAYIKQGDNRWEILIVEDTQNAILSLPEVNVGSPISPSVGSTCELRGQTGAAGGTKIYFGQPLTLGPVVGKEVFIGPAVKTAQFDIDASTVVEELIENIQDNQGSYDTFYTNDLGPALNQHVQASPVTGDPFKLSLSARSKSAPYLQIGLSFPRPKVGPSPLEYVESSLHERLGFVAGDLDTTSLLTPAELAQWINEGTSGALAEVVTEETGLGESLQTLASSAVVIDLSVLDFSIRVRVGDQIEILNGVYSRGVRQILSISGSDLYLSGDQFVSSEEGLSYRLFRDRVRVASTKTSRGSSIEVVSGPAELGFPSGVSHGLIPYFEAVNKVGELFPFDNIASGVLPGDILRIAGTGEFEVLEVDGSTLNLVSGLPSNMERKSFEVLSASARAYSELSESLTAYTTSPSLLKKHKFDEGVAAVDSAITAAILPGQNFVSSRNQARTILADLLSILTDEPPRAGEYSAAVPVASLNLEDILSGYSTSPILAMGRLLDAFIERKYNRAANLLTTGQIEEFFKTDEETGSYGGTLTQASRSVDRDLPEEPTSSFAVDERMNLAVASEEVVDADKDFGDTEDGGLNIEE